MLSFPLKTPPPGSISGDGRASLAALGAFVLLATLLPFTVIPGTTAIPLTLVPLAAFNAIWLWRILVGRRRVPHTRLAALSVAVAAIAALAFGSGVARFGYTPAAGLAFAQLVLCLGLLLGVPASITDVRMLQRLYRLLVAGTAISAAIGLVLWALPATMAADLLLGLAPLGYPEGPELIRVVYGTTIERATGTSVDANLFGGLLLIGATLVGSQIFGRDPIWPRAVLVGIAVGLFAALVLTFSRSAWVGFGVALAYLSLTVNRRMLVVLAVALVLALAAPPLRDRLAGAFFVRDAASLLRVEEYRASVALVLEHPWLGVGFGEASGLNLVRRVSNMYLLMAEQIGIPGLVTLLGLLGVVARTLWRSARPQGPRDTNGVVRLSPGLGAAFLGCLVVGFFDHYFLNTLFPHSAGLFFLVAGLTLAAHELEVTRPAHGPV